MDRIRLSQAFAGLMLPRALRGPVVCLLVLGALLVPANPAPAAVSHVASTCTTATFVYFPPTTLVVNKPSGTTTNDLMVLSMFVDVGSGWTWDESAPAGWTALRSSGNTVSYYKFAIAGEPASYTVVTGGFSSGKAGATITTFRGVDAETPFSTTGALATGSDASVELPNTTASRAGSMRVSPITVGTARSTTFPAPMVESADCSGSGVGLSTGYEPIDGGTTPSRTATLSGTGAWVGQTYVVQPEPSPPNITGLAPSSGPTSGGTSVTISGNGFTGTTGASGVRFGATNATSYTVDNDGQITATAPAGSGTQRVTVTTPAGASPDTAADDYTYVPAPTVTGLAPGTGPAPGGTSVTITGTNLTAASAVTFGGVNATGYTVDSATQITATAPAGSGTVDVRVTTVGGQSANTAADNFVYIPAPAITSVAPAVGPESGGTVVTITGTNFTGASEVRFGATNAASYTVDSDSQITATAPAATGLRHIRVTTPSGLSPNTAADDFTFVAVPAVTSVAPASGPTSGGNTVTITGTNFTGVSAVTFGGVNATGFTVDSATQITATAPAGSGTVDIRVTTAGGQSANTAADNFAYASPPTVTGLAPSSGPAAGGTTVTITGANLTDASAVTFGGVSATGVTVDSATQITATAPAGSAGVTDVRVTTPGGQSANTAADNYTYIPAPTITGVAPATGPQGGGTSVTITGTNFTGATTVQFGGVNATGFTVNSATQITATSPAGTGAVSVSVTTAGGASANTPADDYTYAPVPTVTGLAPDEGPMSGGTSVTITGTGFTGASAVTFGGVNATGYVVDSATQITATTPANALPVVVDVRVTTPGGTSANTAADNYRYEHPCGGGGFDVNFPDFGFDPLALNGLDQTGAQNVTVPVSDLTALGLGWKVQIGVDRFQTAGGKQLPADAARVTNVAASSVGGTCVPPTNGVSGYPLTLPLDPSKVTVFNAGAGTGLGPAALDVEMELDVPASATSGTYTSSWTVDLTAAP